MEQSVLFESLQDPMLYEGKSVEVMQTHISFVVLAGDFVYKIKKSVDFGFLDFSDLKKRKFFCEAEVELNSRLCPKLYLGVVKITKTEDGGVEFDGSGEVVEYAVKMKRFSQDRLMSSLLDEGMVEPKVVEDIVSELTAFYKKDSPSKEERALGGFDVVWGNVLENFDQTKDVVDVTIPSDWYEQITSYALSFLKENKSFFDSRVIDGFIHDCHGDLHSGNIVIEQDGSVCIFDCIEFNKRFRFGDVCSDIAFLAMDLDAHNKMMLASFLAEKYQELSGDVGSARLLNFYKCYRAYVRGKVLGFRLSDPMTSQKEKQAVVDQASRYFELSLLYARLDELKNKTKKPFVVLVSGFSGTGKSTFARRFASDCDAALIRSDVIRKNLAGVDCFERHLDEPDSGLYDPKHTDATYEQMILLAEEELKKNRCVVLDATFLKKKYRDGVYDLGRRLDVSVVVVNCVAPDEMVKIWLDERLKGRSESDGRWEIFLHQKKTFLGFDETEKIVKLDMSMMTDEKWLKAYPDCIDELGRNL